MRWIPLILCATFPAVTGHALAQGVTARHADPVQAHQTNAVQPYTAPAVRPMATPMVASTAVHGTSPKAWHWQSLSDTGVAGNGVARGSQLRNIRCAGVICKVFQDSAGAWTIQADGGFPEIAGQTFSVLLMNGETNRLQTDSRHRGVFSNGSFWDHVDTWRLPPGSYRVFYHWPAQDRVFAAITFDVQHHHTASRPSNKERPASNPHNQQLIDTAIHNQRCLAMAATNPDVRCTLAP